jgi:serine phosphatase RsbU (regulator of sigma subunit)
VSEAVDSRDRTADLGSITSSPGFQSRLMQSELRAATIMLGLWAAALCAIFARRWLGGAVMAANGVFVPTVGLLGSAIVYEALVIGSLRRRVQSGQPLPRWRWLAAILVELAVPTIALAILLWHSPRSGESSLAAPAILGYPVVVLLSILRLRPRVTLAMGLATALLHAGLVTYAIAAGEIERSHWPPLYTYAVLLALNAIAAAMVAAQGRSNVIEAVREASEAEAQQRVRAAMEHDLDIARDIQSGLMPSGTPAIAGFDVAGMARPAQQTGGDYYDWQPLSDGRLLVALADVTGHGIGPALVMAVCRAYARASVATARDAAALLEQINSLIVEDIGRSGRFITMVIAILAPDGTVELVSAGHGPTLLYRRATGMVETFGGDGLPLGIAAGEQYGPTRTIRMEEGDLLLLATDGFMEWPRKGDGEQFGDERLAAAIASGAGESAAASLRHLDAQVHAFVRGEPQHDDTTAVAIKRVGIGALG